MTIALEEIEIFKNKIAQKKGLVKEELTLLSPKLLIDKPLDEIKSLIEESKEDYFDLVKEQFEMITGISDLGEKVLGFHK